MFLFLTAILHRVLKNFFLRHIYFFHILFGLLFPFFLGIFQFKILLDFYFPSIFGLLFPFLFGLFFQFFFNFFSTNLQFFFNSFLIQSWSHFGFLPIFQALALVYPCSRRLRNPSWHVAEQTSKPSLRSLASRTVFSPLLIKVKLQKSSNVL